MDALLRILLPIYFVVYFAAAFFWRSYRVWKQTGVNPYVLGKTDNAHDFIGKIFRLTSGLSVVVIILYATSTSWYQYLAPIIWLQRSALRWCGLLLLVLSLIWIAIAQAQMGSSWRIGIDAKRQTTLVHHGLFRLSRNPIFLGMRVNLLGFFLVLPNAATLLILILGDVLMQIQVRLEEEYLRQVHGKEYQQYCRQTRRWI